MGRIRQQATSLHENSRSLWVPASIREYHGDGDAVSFLRDHVGQSVPCVWRGCAAGWGALEKWPNKRFQHLRDKVGQRQIEVAITPDGRADAILEVQDDVNGRSEKAFAMPHQLVQLFGDFLDDLCEIPSQHEALGREEQDNSEARCFNFASSVPYYSAQNSSLSREVPELLDDIDPATIHFAEEAFGAEPSAANIWIGDGRSVTTMHADPFENMYAVVSGTKLFELRPPCDAALLPKPALRRVRWVPFDQKEHSQTEGHAPGIVANENVLTPCVQYPGWTITTEDGLTEWIDEDSIKDEWNDSLHVKVNPGDLLYLPALWFHRVRQNGVTMAVNWWFEMSFGQNWVYKEFCAGFQGSLEEEMHSEA